MTLSSFIRKQERWKLNESSIQLGKGIKNKQNENRRKKLIKIKAEINKIEQKPLNVKTGDLIN